MLEDTTDNKHIPGSSSTVPGNSNDLDLPGICGSVRCRTAAVSSLLFCVCTWAFNRHVLASGNVSNVSPRRISCRLKDLCFALMLYFLVSIVGKG